MENKIGFIGCGNMAQAMIGGIIASGLVRADSVLVSNRSRNKLERIRQEYGVTTEASNKKVAGEADIVILAVKPDVLPAVAEEIRDGIQENTVVVSIAAGHTLFGLEKLFGEKAHLLRAMPNTPALAGESMSALCPGGKVTEEELESVLTIFRSFGLCEVIPEQLMDAFIGVCGSSPAYIFMLIEAMADAGVMGGLKREPAYRFAAQAVLGSAKMVLETGRHPGELKDMVCSPAGTTIAGVVKLEEEGFRSSVIQGILACMEKSKEMSKK